ncbi:aldehyde dehydrogenase family protein [Zobellella maritima]|uniref:aldehyde dehydrogenase family protein n=1 Tax=Zobellella maritima TaxID=2059725 RepID=UPI0018E4DE06|nr:aldehyde dehydrogenase family protein [Zobellella maritima]
MIEKKGHYIAGREVEASDGKTMRVINPATDEVLAEVAQGTAVDMDTAVKAAYAQLTQGAWQRLSGEDRGRLLYKLAELVERDTGRIADLDAACIGRPRQEPRLLDLPNAVSTLRNCAGWADKIEGRTIPTPGYMGTPTLSYTSREPVGVVGAILPWNTPFMITVWKLAPLLAAGCTVVLKPSEEAPLSALHLARLCQEAGFPGGVVNVVTGLGEVVGHELCVHPLVDKISFTGSPEVGRIIQGSAGSLFKHVALELGGKSPQIVFEDADLERAVQGCALGIFFNSGQVCAAGSRILVHHSLLNDFAQRLAEIAGSIKVGDPTADDVQMGSLASRTQQERVNHYISQGIKEGAQLLSGGIDESMRGCFVKPTVFVGDNGMNIAQEEIFGPVATVIGFKDEAEAIRIANDTRYGLAATIWTSSLSRAHRLARDVKAGAIAVNCWAPIDARLPWGGMKSSGLGRECGLAGVLAYTEEKVVTVLMDEAD